MKLIATNCLLRQRKTQSRPPIPESVRGTVDRNDARFGKVGPDDDRRLVFNLTTAGGRNGDGTGRSADRPTF